MLALMLFVIFFRYDAALRHFALLFRFLPHAAAFFCWLCRVAMLYHYAYMLLITPLPCCYAAAFHFAMPLRYYFAFMILMPCHYAHLRHTTSHACHVATFADLRFHAMLLLMPLLIFDASARKIGRGGVFRYADYGATVCRCHVTAACTYATLLQASPWRCHFRLPTEDEYPRCSLVTNIGYAFDFFTPYYMRAERQRI